MNTCTCQLFDDKKTRTAKSHEHVLLIRTPYGFLFPFMYAYCVQNMQRPIIIFPFSKIVLFITYQVQQARQEYQASSGILKTALEIHTPKHILQHILLSSHLQKFQNE